TPDSIVEPAPTQPGAAITTNCDLTGDIPIVTQLSPGDSPLTQTALYLVQADQGGTDPRGTLTVECEGEDRIVLAENVISAWQGPWPGIASFAVLPPEVDDPAQQQSGFIDVATGRTLLFGPGGQSEMVSDRFSADGSPWVAGPSVDDPATALLADLRTFEARSFADVIGMPLPGAPLLVSNPADDGTLAIGFARTGSIDARGGVYTSDVEGPDGVLVLGASFDDIDWISSPETLPFISPLAVSPDGSMLAAVSSGEGDTLSSYTFGLIDLSNGEVTAASEAVPYTGTPRILWVEDGASAVYLSGSTLQKLDVAGPGGPTTVFDAGEQLESVRKTWSPNVVVVEERQDHGSDATADQTAQDIVYSVDLATGETQEFAGIDVSGMIGWLPDSGALVMYEWLDTAAELATYAVFDPVSGERIGEIKDAPSFQFEVQSRSIVIGRDSVSISANGHVEVASLGTQHIYLFAVDGDTMSMRQVPSPEGLLSEIALTANVYLSPDGSQLSLTGEGDEGRTRYLIDLTDPDSGWIEIPSSGVGGPGPIGFMPGPTR
ncbi:MAG: hypothetical protein IT335_06430, partial [Thermomicrobiales bacterium]|nr:hypothetical protein [Thermomicrobiales bacterium]